MENIHIGNGVVYATDDNYVRHVSVSLISLFEHTTSTDFNIYIVGNNLSSSNSKYLIDLAKGYGKDIQILDCSKILRLLPKDLNTGNLSISTYIRLFSASLIPKEIEKVLYLDCDTYICVDIHELFDMPLENNLVAGVEDTMYPHLKTDIGLKQDARYINAGVLLINLELWRKEGIQQRFIEFINKFNGQVPHLDQGVINGVLKSRIKFLPLKYNVQSPVYAFHKYDRMLAFHEMSQYYPQEEFIQAKKKPAIIHYTSFFTGRPWEKGCIHPLRLYYHNSINKTIFATNPYTKKLSTTRRLKMLCFKYFQPIYLLVRKL